MSILEIPRAKRSFYALPDEEALVIDDDTAAILYMATNH